MTNAYQHGVVDQYANVKLLEYVIRPLLSINDFINELICVFGDKTSLKTPRYELDECKQGNTSIMDYDSHLNLLSFHIQETPEDTILKYIAGLHPEVRREATRREGWGLARTSATKQMIAVEGANITEELAFLPAPKNHLKLSQHPHYHSAQTHLATTMEPIPGVVPILDPLW